jgi:hypothetical protein
LAAAPAFLSCAGFFVSGEGFVSGAGFVLAGLPDPVMTTMLVTVGAGGGADFVGGADSAGLSPPCGAAKPITAAIKNRLHRSRMLCPPAKEILSL